MALETASTSVQDLYISLRKNYKDVPLFPISFFFNVDFRVPFMKYTFNCITLLLKSFKELSLK